MDDEAKSPVKTKDKANINTAPKVHELLEKEDKISKLWANSKYEFFISLTPSWRTSLLYKNQSIGLLCKSMEWFLYDRDVCHEKVNTMYCRQH